jgi:thiol-disulfide isomerase/thioredoxin
MALVHTPATLISVPCPDFNLWGTDLKWHTLAEFKNNQPLLVMFICNHCPYVKAIEDRLILLAHDLKKHDINTVAICSNDEDSYPEDRFEKLQARSIEKKYPFVYLHDKDQTIAKKFNAVCTPDFFLYDAKLNLQYRGRLDDFWKDETQVSKRELYTAALDLKTTGQLSFQQTPSMGCSIKWIKND